MLVVEAFLVIASYFLTSKFLKTEQSEIAVGEVFLHRIKRLYPAYLTIVFLFTVVLFAHTRRCMAVPVVGGHHADGSEKILKGSLCDLCHFWYSMANIFHINGQIWLHPM